MKSIVCVAHERDVDGIGCHAILHRYAKLNDYEIKHFFTDYHTFCRDLSAISVKGAEIIIADLSYNEGFSICMKMLRDLSSKNKVRWFDHHDWGSAKINQDINLVVDQSLCASEILQRDYLPKDKIATDIAALAHAHDFRKDNETAWKLYEVISSGYDKMKLVESLAEGNFWTKELEDAYDSYQKIKEQGYFFLDEHSKLYKIGDWSVMIGFSTKKLSSTVASEHLLKKETDFVICLWDDGKMSFRRNNNNINLKNLASLFKGGGRQEAAGGFLYQAVSEKNYLETFERVIEKISLSYEDINLFQC